MAARKLTLISARCVINNIATPGAPLPLDCGLGLDTDGDFWIVPPAKLTIFSEPGECVLLGRCRTAKRAAADARAYLAGL